VIAAFSKIEHHFSHSFRIWFMLALADMTQIEVMPLGLLISWAGSQRGSLDGVH
jgi:hypothetical protein